MAEKFKIKKSKDGQYYFTLQAANNEIIATSEMYTTKQNCENVFRHQCSHKKYYYTVLPLGTIPPF